MKKEYIRPSLIVGETDDKFIVFEPPKMPFWKKLIIYCSVWIALIIIACWLAHSIVLQYDRAQPEYAMNEYMLSTAKQDMFFAAIANTEFDKKNPYEPAYELSAKLANHYQDKFTYTRADSDFTVETPVYIIRHDGNDLFRITLELHNTTGFMKYPGYTFKSIELLDKSLFSFETYRVVFPNNAYIFINGHRLTRHISQTYPMFEIFESGRSAALGKDYYASGNNNYYGIIMDNFAFEPDISALQATSAENKVPLECTRIDNYFIFDYAGAELFTTTISAPENAEVHINDFAVSDVFLAGTDTYVDSYGSSVNMKVYKIPTVYKNSTIEASIEGSVLNTTTEDLHVTALPKKISRSVILPSDSTLFVNGNPIDKDQSGIKSFEVFGTDDYRGIIITGLIAEPDICAFSSDQTSLLNRSRLGEHIVFGGEELSKLTISAPSDATVRINEKEVSASYKSDSYTITADGENSTLDVTEYTVIAKKTDETNITVSKEQTRYPVTAIANNDSVLAALPEKFGSTVVVPYNARLYLNGAVVSPDLIKEDGVLWHSDFDSLSSYPKATEYIVPKDSDLNNFVAEEIGKAWLQKHADGITTVFTHVYDAELKNTYSTFATEFVAKYLNYYASDSTNAKSNMNNVIKHTLTKGPAYRSLVTSRANIECSAKKSIQIQNSTADNFVAFGDDSFTCDVSYTAIIESSLGKTIESSTVHLVFQKSEGSFKVSKIIF